jgi:hypothetical protein
VLFVYVEFDGCGGCWAVHVVQFDVVKRLDAGEELVCLGSVGVGYFCLIEIPHR